MTNQEILIELFQNWNGEYVSDVVPLPRSGSLRRYYRIIGKDGTAIGAYNPDIKENEAYLYLSTHFRKHKLNVPELYNTSPDNKFYLLEDLGNTTLFHLIEKDKIKTNGQHIIELYKKSLDHLLKFQIAAASDLDFSVCYPRSTFDKTAILWDLNYFKYYFLKPAHVLFNEQHLETDFQALAEFLSKAESGFFMYRDFQARNIMIRNDQPYFIDYQGGRMGPLQYDVASLLFQAKAALTPEIRESLLNYYLNQLETIKPDSAESFLKYYYSFVLIRTIQVLGAYGFRGLIEKKPHFIASIPYALKNLEWLIEKIELPVSIPEIRRIAHEILLKNYLQGTTEPEKLTVTINSFSYKRSIPVDMSGNGGGFVFDCRILPNPGREEQYRKYNGKDQEIISYLSSYPEVKKFLSNVISIIEQAVKNYSERSFKNLMVNFGCTGGQHRSVYCAEQLAKYLDKSSWCSTTIKHTELDNQ